MLNIQQVVTYMGKLPSDWKQANITPVLKKGSTVLVLPAVTRVCVAHTRKARVLAVPNYIVKFPFCVNVASL
jgi:hypothetical protein